MSEHDDAQFVADVVVGTIGFLSALGGLASLAFERRLRLTVTRKARRVLAARGRIAAAAFARDEAERLYRLQTNLLQIKLVEEQVRMLYKQNVIAAIQAAGLKKTGRLESQVFVYKRNRATNSTQTLRIGSGTVFISFPLRFPKNRGVQYGFVLNGRIGAKGHGFIERAKLATANSPAGLRLYQLAYVRSRLLRGY